MAKNDIIENVTIEKLIFGGKGLTTAPDGRRIIVSGGVIPGSIVDLRILKSKKSHIEAQQLSVVKKSPIEVALQPGYQLYGGAKWLTIGYDDQLRIKEEQAKEAFFPILKWLSAEQNLPNSLVKKRIKEEEILTSSSSHADSSGSQKNNVSTFHPIIPSPEIYGYRNKVEFSWGKYISAKEGVHDEFRFGFHAQGQFDRIENCTYCALADEETNDIFGLVDTLSRDSGFPTYDPKTNIGFWRHFVVRKGKKTGEIMLIFSVNGTYDEDSAQYTVHTKEIFADMVRELTEKWKNITSIYFLENTGKADIVTGNAILLSGKPSIEEELLGYRFEIQPKSFFQVNTVGAEKLYSIAIASIKNKGGTLLDLYAGTGTIGILLSEYFSQVYSVELVESASKDGERNALKNDVKNIQFVNMKVEDFGREWSSKGGKADTIILDPPRDGIHPGAVEHILSFRAREIIYVSCNPATLVRDLEIFLGKNRNEKTEKLSRYRITDITPVDMFPHTHHIEMVVRMEIL